MPDNSKDDETDKPLSFDPMILRPSNWIHEHDALSDNELTRADSDFDSDSDDNDDANQETLFNNPNVPYNFNLDKRIRFQSSRENLLSQKNHLVIFITQTGEPCEKGARTLSEAKILPPIKDATRRIEK